MVCSYACAPGYIQTGGVTSRTCWGGSWSGSELQCTVLPPVFWDQNVTVYENATFDEAVGEPLQYIQQAQDVAVTFIVLEGNTTVFKVGLCNGQIRIKSPLLDYHAQNEYTLLVQAQANGLATAAANATITIYVLNVPHVPVFNETVCQYEIEEGLPIGTLLGPEVYAYDIDGRNVTYSLDMFSGAVGKVTVDNITGTGCCAVPYCHAVTLL